MKNRRLKIINLLLIALIISCQAPKQPTPSEKAVAVTNVSPAKKTEQLATSVKVQPAEYRTFSIQSTATGLLTPAQQTTLHLKSTGTIQQLPIQEGQYIQKGQLIAALNDQALQLDLEQQELALADAVVNKKDLLIANGGDAEVDTSVSAERLDLILTLSGYKRAQQSIKRAEFQLTQTKVYAPFSGVVADLKIKQYEQGNMGQAICRLLNPATFEATFQLTEEEALRIQKGQTVRVSPLATPEKSYVAKVSTINPIVNEQGLVTVRAQLKNIGKNRLYEGMHVQVALSRNVPNQLVIPKTALVLRSGKAVVFTYDEQAQLAKWNYVEVAQENETEIAIAEGLTKNDLVIYEGNNNLSHEAEVQITK